MSLFLLCLGNHTYAIANFQIQSNEMLFKTSAHKYALRFNSGTSLGNFNKHAIPPKLIKFTPFEEIISREWKKNMLIGLVVIFKIFFKVPYISNNFETQYFVVFLFYIVCYI